MNRRLPREVCEFFRRTPRARAVYVEGLTDKKILERAFFDCGRDDITVYAIDSTIDFSGSGINPGRSNKARCIALAEFLASCEYAKEKAVCVVDADQDYYCDAAKPNEFLIYTEHADLLLYFAKAPVLSYGLGHLIPGSVDAEELVRELLQASHVLFKVRRSVQTICPEIAFVEDVRNSCTFTTGGTVTVNVDRLMQQILNPVRKMSLMNELRLAIDQTQTRDDLPISRQICGHDFVQLLRGILIKLGHGPVEEPLVQSLLLAGQAGADLCKTNLIREIFARLSF